MTYLFAAVVGALLGAVAMRAWERRRPSETVLVQNDKARRVLARPIQVRVVTTSMRDEVRQ